MSGVGISSVAFTAAAPADAERGLVGYVSCLLGNALLVDGITLRRTQDGRLTLGWPHRRDTRGEQHHYLRPLNDGVRREIEREVFRQLGQLDDLGAGQEVDHD